ncbi:MAG TPA: flagellar export protein FliJ [Firmicutes bacterium]|nr:flagellar export protein FliJ [Bacillota bacterium]
MFKFRLEKVLRVHEIREEKSKHEWAFLESSAQKARAQLAQLLQHKSEIIQFGYGHADFKIRASMYSYLSALERRIEAQNQKIKLCEKRAAEAKKAWLEARQEEKKITTLKEKHQAEYVKEKERRQQKVLDDMRSHLKSG